MMNMADDEFQLPIAPPADPNLPGSIELGALSISLNVADLAASREFYEALGFEATGGDADSDYLIMKNGESTLGLFHGMFDRNIVTFNPGLTNRMEKLESFTDVRAIQAHLQNAGCQGLRLGGRHLARVEAQHQTPARGLRPSIDGSQVNGTRMRSTSQLRSLSWAGGVFACRSTPGRT